MSENGYVARWVQSGVNRYFYYYNSEKQCWAKYYPEADIPLVIFIETDDYARVAELATEIMGLTNTNLTPVNTRPHPFYDGSWICDFVRPEEVVIV